MKVLLIEDDSSVIATLTQFFESKRIELQVIRNAQEALHHILRYFSHFDMFLTGLQLSGMKGEEFIQEVREAGINVPMIILGTSNDSDELQEDLLRRWVDDYILKPLNPNILIARMEAILRRYRGERERTIVMFDNLRFDKLAAEVRRGTKIIQLSNRQLDLLELFIQNQGKIVDLYTIKDEIWGSRAQLNQKTIRSHICELRKRVDKGQGVKLIHTIPLRGYYFGYRGI